MVQTVNESSSENIWIASSDGDLEAVKALIEKGLSPDSQDSLGYSPLHASVSYGHYNLAKYLLEKGASPNLPDEDDETPLHFCETVECAKLLLEYGADPNLKNSEEVTPYQSALDDENIELAEFLKVHTDVADQIQIQDAYSHIDYDGNNNYQELPDSDLTAPFVSQFEQVMNDTTLESEEKRDEKLNELVLNLLQSHVEKKNESNSEAS
ncbi:hypothetical protein DSO57_1027769 [Entomophthora muscae]|uniref:Uncharacterized protein n=1 Tax=Entomophthora muscae TaxID=34485 RepID=A0ACC2RSR3_9FUNG|nr:hypothetical protein DSO57_1027769 [Entomophthora muscae]